MIITYLLNDKLLFCSAWIYNKDLTYFCGIYIFEQQFFQDGPRIEAAFRKHIHRADVDQVGNSVEIYVCHANVIRYFVCR